MNGYVQEYLSAYGIFYLQLFIHQVKVGRGLLVRCFGYVVI